MTILGAASGPLTRGLIGVNGGYYNTVWTGCAPSAIRGREKGSVSARNDPLSALMATVMKLPSLLNLSSVAVCRD
jgi:hypothetical protein